MPEYTLAAVAAAVAVVVLELTVLRTGLFRRRAYWIAMVIVFGFQALVDGWLTKGDAPYVLYDADATTGVRAPWDIPIEDFLYGFALVTFVLLLWERARPAAGLTRYVVTAATIVLLVGGWLAGWALAGRAHRLADLSDDCDAAGSAAVSVIVPARDEAARLPRLLDALAAAAPPPHEVIVVDDGSTDSTAAIARVSGASVVSAEPPTGWTGKSWACQRGAETASGDVLVFLDADTEPGPEAVARLARAASATGGFVSAQPRHRVERLYERASAGPAIVTLLGAGTGPPPTRRWWRRPMVFGPAVAVTTEAYRRAGGHAAVRGAVAEDVALARAADDAAVPVTAVLGDHLLAYRMYPEGAAHLVEGWTKNLAAGAGAIPPARLVAVVVWVTGALQAAVGLASSPGAVAALVYGAFVVQFGLVLRRVGRFGPATAALYPIVLSGFVLLFAVSVAKVAVGRPVSWRGRRVQVRS